MSIHVVFTTPASNGLILWKGERLPGFDDDEYEGTYLAIAGVLLQFRCGKVNALGKHKDPNSTFLYYQIA